jgi:putative AlgH/UPF0301 family transcriptional regulator
MDSHDFVLISDSNCPGPQTEYPNTSRQLESEIRTNSWLSIPFSDEILFHTPFQNRWEKSIGSLGIAAENLSEEIGHA